MNKWIITDVVKLISEGIVGEIIFLLGEIFFFRSDSMPQLDCIKLQNTRCSLLFDFSGEM